MGILGGGGWGTPFFAPYLGLLNTLHCLSSMRQGKVIICNGFRGAPPGKAQREEGSGLAAHRLWKQDAAASVFSRRLRGQRPVCGIFFKEQMEVSACSNRVQTLLPHGSFFTWTRSSTGRAFGS